MRSASASRGVLHGRTCTCCPDVSAHARYCDKCRETTTHRYVSRSKVRCDACGAKP